MTPKQKNCKHYIMENSTYSCKECNLPWDKVEQSRRVSNIHEPGPTYVDNKPSHLLADAEVTSLLTRPPKQVGGSHYEQAIEPIQYIEANNLDFSTGNIIKYASRFRRKNGKEDLLKVIWYAQHLIDTEYSGND